MGPRTILLSIAKETLLLSLGLTAMVSPAGASPARPRECQPSPAHHATSLEGVAEAIDQYLRSLGDFDFSGTVLVEKEGRVLFHESYGWADREEWLPVSQESVFWIGSLSKQFTATAILKLQEQGKLKPGDPIAKYLDVVPVEKRGITIHQLLTHSSGLTQRYAADGVSQRDKAVRAVLKSPLAQPPGAAFGYSNDAYNLLAVIVEVASGQTFEEYLHDHLFEPAGMSHTGFTADRARWGRLPVAARARGAPRKGNPQDWKGDWGLRGATGILSTAGDLYKWHLALRAGEILSEESRKRMLTPHVSRSESLYYGYGWNLASTPSGQAIIHSGDDDLIGHSSTYRRYVDRNLLVIVVSNAGYHDGLPVAQIVGREVARIVLN